MVMNSGWQILPLNLQKAEPHHPVVPFNESLGQVSKEGVAWAVCMTNGIEILKILCIDAL